ncbi:hypothetical protein TUM20286_59280 [Pseudomonas tohonis]|uniref:Uncharacterized protein n=1 Tax=Pseudomonas tohonis TaxID=2725477 RepID=A0ABQ4W9W4_9PSED|nr:hypothetical protein TUM20286_59280 [Pseudomonas tohonis]
MYSYQSLNEKSLQTVVPLPFRSSTGSRVRHEGPRGWRECNARRGITREHGGELHLHNRPEGGLRARVELPWG